MSILENINSAADVKALDTKQTQALCCELRDFLIRSVSKTGGHLASSLGAVELSAAIIRVFDTARDRIIYDVGHQSYVHKILTGRRDDFASLRKLGGISGYPKPSESVHDAFVSGHASTSVSAALGMAVARTLSGENHKIVSIIGDGALTGGLAYEGLCCAGASHEPLLVILNDNGMSISKNVGGAETLLSRMRLRPGYLRFKRAYRKTIGRIPPLYKLTHRLKEWLKAKLIASNIFSDMGFNYLGPVDGHDLAKLETILSFTRELREPVLLHVITQKGRGYPPAEKSPDDFHGVSPFDPVSPNPLENQKALPRCFSEEFGLALCALAEDDEKIMAITAAMTDGTGLTQFRKSFPRRFFDAGIAEGHAVTFAAGMAKQGLIPVFAVYSSFLQRGFDMLIHDVSLLNLHCVFAVDRAGLTGADGETHHGAFDIAYLSCVPGMTILCPASFAELRSMLKAAIYNYSGPVALRYPRGGEGEYTLDSSGAPSAILTSGADVTIAAYGMMINEAIAAARILAKSGIHAEVIKLSVVSPLPESVLLASLKKTQRLVISEDVCAAGSVGGQILALCAKNSEILKGSRLLNLGGGIATHGTIPELLEKYGLDAKAIVRAVKELCPPGYIHEKTS